MAQTEHFGTKCKLSRTKLQCITNKISKLLSEIWRRKKPAEQECGPQHPITKKLISMHAEVQALLQETSVNGNRYRK